MKSINLIGDLITEAAKLYFELCQLAESSFDMGPYSGAKRTILLHLAQKSSAQLSDLADEFKDPAQSVIGTKIISEMAQSGLILLIKTEAPQGYPHVSLTEAGQAKVREIIKYESSLAKHLHSELSLAELRKTLKTMEAFRESMEVLRTQESMPVNKNIAS
jgi:DNA-binding MarR family transcriptional regulator